MQSNRIFPLLYAAPISYYAQYLSSPGRIDKCENFSKQNFRSRCRIYGANGVITLSIPTIRTHHASPVNKVEISNIDNWQVNHWKTLTSAYASSPFFMYYTHLILPLYTHKYDTLWAFNFAFHQVLLTCLDTPIQSRFTEQFIPITPPDLRADYSTKRSHPKSQHFESYQQVFSYTGPFETDLSILDGLFNLGPELIYYLSKIKNQL